MNDYMVVYISGRYRHYLPGKPRTPEHFDRKRMRKEVEDEQRWAQLVFDAGCAPLCPLANTVFLDESARAREFIARDLAILRRLAWKVDGLLLRPGWDDEPVSEGAALEYEAAVEQKLVIIHGCQGAETAMRYLSDLAEGAAG